MNSALRRKAHEKIVRGVRLRMRNAPAPADVPDTADAYFDWFVEHGLADADADRVDDAFEACFTNDDWFPSAPTVYRALPKNIHRPANRLEHHPSDTPDIARQAFAKMRKVVG